MVHWSDAAIESVARRRAIVVLGAGSSLHSTPEPGASRPPDWKSFLLTAADRLATGPKKEAKKLISASEYLSSCEIIKTHLGPDWPRVVDEAYGNQRLEPGDLHTQIYGLDLPIVMTTNFDKVYQSAATRLSSSTIKVKTYRDQDLGLLAKGNASSRVLLKTHGSIDDIGSMIFTRSDYVRLRTEFPLFQRVISALAVTNTLIFVGCGLRDPDMILLLEDLAAATKGFGNHICLTDSRQSAELERVYNDCFGLTCIKYKYDESHSQLPVAIEQLQQLATKRRSELASAALW